MRGEGGGGTSVPSAPPFFYSFPAARMADGPLWAERTHLSECPRFFFSLECLRHPHHTRLSPKKDSTHPRTGIAKANAPPYSSSSPSLLILSALKPVPVVCIYVRERFLAEWDTRE